MNKLGRSLVAFSAILILAACGGYKESQETLELNEDTYIYEANVDENTIFGDIVDNTVPLADKPVLVIDLNPVASGVNVKKNNQTIIDYSNTKDGYIMVAWLDKAAKVKVLVKGPSGTSYQYNLRTDKEYDTFPLSDGNGTYTVSVYKNVSGTSYSTVITQTMQVKMTDEFAPFIRPNQFVNYTKDSKAIAKANELCNGVDGNLAKVEKIYSYVINNVTYDKQKAQTVQSGYLPNIDDTYETKKGICFDYASLMSAMLRSQGVPVKLIVGYTGNAYHAWINVYSETEGWIESKIYFDGKEWKLMDPTFASSGNNSESIRQYIGNGDNYSAKYQY